MLCFTRLGITQIGLESSSSSSRARAAYDEAEYRNQYTARLKVWVDIIRESDGYGHGGLVRFIKCLLCSIKSFFDADSDNVRDKYQRYLCLLCAQSGQLDTAKR